MIVPSTREHEHGLAGIDEAELPGRALERAALIGEGERTLKAGVLPLQLPGTAAEFLQALAVLRSGGLRRRYAGEGVQREGGGDQQSDNPRPA